LTVAGLHSPDEKNPPITDVLFVPTADRKSIQAVITLRKEHGLGTYSGTVFAEEDHAPLGRLTVQVTK
jgi:hypothetical protein